MSETARTAAFAAAAVVAGALAFFTASGPATTAAGFEQVGTPFYDGFDSLADVGRFTVTAFEEETGLIRDFRIDRDGETGAYAIAPYGYPAEAAEKLGETAAAVANVKRAALKSRRPADWADLGVVDPGSEDEGELDGRGLRVALTAADGNVLADLIIGNPVEGRDGFYYVRAPRDDSTYIAEVDLDLSARFRDWIDPEVLGVEAGDLRRIVLPDERVDDRQPRLLVGENTLVLSRDEAFGQWSAEGVPDGKQVDQAAANALARTAAGLSIVGVRPKPAGLKPDLTIDPAVVRSQVQYDLIAQNIAGKGFNIVGTDDGGAQVVGGAGQLTVAEADGVTFDLDFGDLFTGTDYDVAVGDFGAGPKRLGDAEGDGEGEDDDNGESQSRYLFVTARFDPALLGQEPAAPRPPAEDDEEELADGEETADTRFERETRGYETALAEYQEKKAAAEARVADLNARFGDWYYVIDAEDAAELTLSPDVLLEDAPAEGEERDGDGAPALPTLSAPGERPVTIGGGGEPAGEPEAEAVPAPVAESGADTDPADRRPLVAPKPAAGTEEPAADADAG